MSAPMVRALLDGTKTQTRRIVKPEGANHLFQFRGTTAAAGADEPTGSWAWCGSERTVHKHITCPYGVPGDRLWVREAWGVWFDCYVQDSDEPTWYRADQMDPDAIGPSRWRPSIHMPRHRSRILLEVTEVRVERLQDISEADAIAEGIEYLPRMEGYGLPDGSHYHGTDPRISYWSLWEFINGAGSVGANPWVWCVSFRRITP